MFHWFPVDDERRESRLPEAPLSVSVWLIVCVVPAVKVRVSAIETDFVRL